MTRIILLIAALAATAAFAFFPKEGELNPIARGDACGIMLEWKPGDPGAVTLREVPLGARISACRSTERAAYDAVDPLIGRFAQ